MPVWPCGLQLLEFSAVKLWEGPPLHGPWVFLVTLASVLKFVKPLAALKMMCNTLHWGRLQNRPSEMKADEIGGSGSREIW